MKSISLIAAVIISGAVLPAAAADLPIPPLHKAEIAAPVKKAVRYAPARVRATQLALVCPAGCARFMLVLGIAY
jgi:hypothetical protein